ncbi:transposase IS200-family protein [Cyanobacterium stanieri PCC 7202]|uniref:Transposase IS200-family protein n=1 Tax=Cyanobacterium stanieri (strain ATCC 29140 / PCC 7202) TaxID=292563 RepID=K9YL83_CYASC|nr:transposase IS200-family protein [Cyanobacterium stanieri PCC 7202]
MSTNYNKGFRSVYKLTAHVLLVTKYRKKAISEEVLIRLKEIFTDTLTKWECNLVEFNGELDHVHLLIDYKPDISLSKLIANLKTVSSRLIRRDFPELATKYFYNKPYFWTGSYFVASCGGVTVNQLKKYVENQKNSSRIKMSYGHFIDWSKIHLPLISVGISFKRNITGVLFLTFFR